MVVDAAEIKREGEQKHRASGLLCQPSNQSAVCMIKATSKAAFMELPPLVKSMHIKGLPPRRQSVYADEAEKCLLEFLERWKAISSLKSYVYLSFSAAAILCSEVVSSERLVVVTVCYALAFVLDDFLFDTPNEELAMEYGIHKQVRESPKEMEEFLSHLNYIMFRRKDEELLPLDATPIETMMWELGQDLKRMSTPDWFAAFSKSFMEHHNMCVSSHSDYIANVREDGGGSIYSQDLESYSELRYGNYGGKFMMMVLELAKDSFLPADVRQHPTMKQLSKAAAIHSAFVNDVFSYSKEIKEEQNPRNLLKVIMDSEGLSFPEAAWRAVNVVNSYATIVLELEAELPATWRLESWASNVDRYIDGVKEYMTGCIYWNSLHKRYRRADAVFPELRIIVDARRELQEENQT